MGVKFDALLGQLRTTDGGGQVNSVVSGENISVDNTDPANPIVSTTNFLIDIDTINAQDNNSLNLTAGAAAVTDSDGLAVFVSGTPGDGIGNGGPAFLVGANGGITDGTTGGTAGVQAGTSNATNGNGGNVQLIPLTGTGTGANGKVHIGTGSGTDVILDNYSLTADRTYTFPDKSGTFAMLSDITGASAYYNETPAGTKNGINTDFTLAQNPVTASTQVYLNGIRETYNVSYTEVAPNIIRFSDPPISADTIIVDYLS